MALLLRPLYEHWLLEATQAPLPAWKRRLLKQALSKDTALRCLAAELAEFSNEPHAPAADKAPDMRTRVVALATAPEPERALFPSGWVPAGGIAVLLLLALVAVFQRPSGLAGPAQSADNMNNSLSVISAPPALSAPPAITAPSFNAAPSSTSVSAAGAPAAAAAPAATGAPMEAAAPVGAPTPQSAAQPLSPTAPTTAPTPKGASMPVESVMSTSNGAAPAAMAPATATSSVSGTAASAGATPGTTPGANPTAHP
ncbi:MAG TPA: hypothetical protein VNZ67_15505 [bacterium]|jgi:hypothetical protein|nr:hypothetical protein [bacterium]